MVEDDLYALVALRNLDRNPVLTGIVEEPAAYPWSSCGPMPWGSPNRLISFHPRHLALSLYPKVHQRLYRALL